MDLHSIQECSDGKVKELKGGAKKRLVVLLFLRIIELSLSNYHPGFATGVVIPSNFTEYQRKSVRIGEVVFSSAGNRCIILTVCTRQGRI